MKFWTLGHLEIKAYQFPEWQHLTQSVFMFVHTKGGSRILARVVHMSDGNAQEAQSLYVRQCIIHPFKRVRAVV